MNLDHYRPTITALFVFAALVSCVVVVGRSFTTLTTPITVHEVAPHRFCALATTSDGVALSCWKEDDAPQPKP